MGLYDPAYEHDSCGVACLARLDGAPAHETISRAIETLGNLEHRGAEGADAETGDGVVDEGEAARSAFGRWVAASRPGRPFGWAVRTDELDAVAARLGLTVRDGARQAPDGRRLTWRMAGIEQAAAEPLLPFFIQWGPETPFPGASGRSVEVHLELRGDVERLRAWLGGHELPITVAPGEPAVMSVTVGDLVCG